MGQKNLAIIGASYLQLPLIEKAKEMGYKTHVFAWKADDVGEKAADVFYPISIIEKDAIYKVCREIGIRGICSIASDLAAITVNYVAEKLGLYGNSMETVMKSTNKHLMRVAFEQNGDPSPKSVLVDAQTDLESLVLSFPVIVKPTDRSGSRGIYKVENANELKCAINHSLDESFENKALIEEYVEGKEYSVEGISFGGKHHILAVTLKHTTGTPHFIEIGHMEPAPISEELYQEIVRIITHALDTLGIRNGASHSEIKIDEQQNVKIIEIGGRMGGDCIGSHLVKYSTGIDYLKAVIQVACGVEPDLVPEGNTFSAEVRFVFNDEDLRIMNAMRRSEKYIETIALMPDNIGKTTDSSNRAGCYILKV
jgi:biotin carboxylase